MHSQNSPTPLSILLPSNDPSDAFLVAPHDLARYFALRSLCSTTTQEDQLLPKFPTSTMDSSTPCISFSTSSDVFAIFSCTWSYISRIQVHDTHLPHQLTTHWLHPIPLSRNPPFSHSDRFLFIFFLFLSGSLQSFFFIFFLWVLPPFSCGPT